MHPILFHIGSYPVRSFGVMIMLSFLAGMWLIRKRAGRFGFEVAPITDLCFTVLIAGVLGARVLFIVQELPYYLKNPSKLLTLQFEGLTSFGGVLFGAAAVLWWAWRHKASVGRLTDLFAPGFLLGHVIGRIGCFLNGCCYGGVCDSKIPWATHFQTADGLHHPAQIYDALMNLVGVGLLLAYERRGFRPGQGAAMFLILHGLTRFIYEFWRAGTVEQVNKGIATSTYMGSLPITEAQVVALIMIAIGVVTMVVAARRKSSETSMTPEPPAPEMQTA